MEGNAPVFFRRLVSFVERVRWMSSLAGSYRKAAAIIFRIRRNPGALQVIPFRGFPVQFRGADEQAIREVLVDQEYEFLRDFLRERPRPRVLDVGAHIGTFGMWLYSESPGAKVLSVEADPATYQVASLNIATGRSVGADWEVMHGAAGSADGEFVRFSSNGPSMSHRIAAEGDVEVPVVSLATLLSLLAADGGRIDLAKVDIEGSEEAFLAEVPAALERIDAFVIELHPGLCDTDHVRAVLNQHFDHIENVGGRKSTKPLLFCTRNIAV